MPLPVFVDPGEPFQVDNQRYPFGFATARGEETMIIFLVLMFTAGAAGIFLRVKDKGEARLAREAEREIAVNGQLVIVRVYRGSRADSFGAFQMDAVSTGAAGYVPTSQSWTPGQWGAGQFFLALLLCLVLIGFIVFIYMAIVKPAGSLSVIYQRTAQAPNHVLDQPRAPVVPDAAEGRQAIRRLYGV